MIKLWYRHHGQRPNQTEIISADAKKASTLPSSFEVVGVEYSRETTGGFDSNQFCLRVDPPSDSISQDAIDSIAAAFESNWGGNIDFVESIVQ